MADTLDLLTLAEGTTAVNIPTANTDHDTELAQQITAVSRIIDAEVGPVVHRTVTELHDGGSRTIFLRQAPAASVSLVRQANGSTITTFDPVAFGGASDGYTLNLGDRLDRTYGGWSSSWSYGQVEVTYVAGRYATTATVDARFKACAASVLRRLWKRESGTWAQSSNFLADQTVDTVGFFRVAKPIIDEMLSYELRLPGVA